MKFDGLATECRRVVQYTEPHLKFMMSVGLAVSAGGSRSALSGVISHVKDYEIKRASVDLSCILFGLDTGIFLVFAIGG